MRLCVVIPAYNEENRLPWSVDRVHSFFCREGNRIWKQWELVVAVNGATDQTLEMAHALAQKHSNIRVVHVVPKGRGGALRRAWLDSEADILSYMDVDLSTDIEALPHLVEAVSVAGYDLAVGSRLLKPELTTRCLKREVASQCYNFLVRKMLRTHFSDAQCGFKALSRQAAKHLLPQIEDTNWFFDTELLVLAEKSGYRIFDLPVRWIEGSESSVNFVNTILDDLRGLRRLRRKLATASRVSPNSQS